jgi:hypothetical protein
LEPPTEPSKHESASLASPAAAETTQSLAVAPLPVPRPADLLIPKGADPARTAERRTSRRPSTMIASASTEDDRSLFEKLFGIQRPPGSALGYAALGNGAADTGPGRRVSPAPSAGSGIAIYDISARIVHMPNGEKLEAHSGLGETMDDPRYVHLRMRGATPPGTYDLTEREQLFHGVRAIRLSPVGGSAAVYGRAGLLAHTYMLGPSGASNGCVSFRDYNRFLQAYLRGEVRRLVVVSGTGQDVVPTVAARAPSRRMRSAARGRDV